MDELKDFPRLRERLHKNPPEGRGARIHEFATDLAIGYEEGVWDSRLFFVKLGGRVAHWSLVGADQHPDLLEALQLKWTEDLLPDFDAMYSVGYFVQLSEKDCILSERTLRLADAPASLLNVFISYKRDKSSAFALLLDSRIRYETNATPFVDFNLLPGDEWHAKLGKRKSRTAIHSFAC